MSTPNTEDEARKIPELREQMDKPTFKLFPAWSEDEYILASDLWKIFKSEHGTSGKKKAIAVIRESTQKEIESLKADRDHLKQWRNEAEGKLVEYGKFVAEVEEKFKEKDAQISHFKSLCELGEKVMYCLITEREIEHLKLERKAGLIIPEKEQLLGVLEAFDELKKKQI